MTDRPSTLTTYVALLRGINVGGNTIISMAALKKCFTQLGLSDVKTYINSGNVIFSTAETDPRELERMIEKALTLGFSHTINVVVRSLADIEHLLAVVPKSWLTPVGSRKCNVIFLRHAVDNPDILKNFAPKTGIEELHYHPGALLWSAETSSLTKSNMLKVNKMPIYREMTVRIFNTVRKIHEIMQQTSKLA